MKDPCKECLVSSCCSEICRERAIFIYNHHTFEKTTMKYLKSLTFDEAIKYILLSENTYLELERDLVDIELEKI